MKNFLTPQELAQVNALNQMMDACLACAWEKKRRLPRIIATRAEWMISVCCRFDGFGASTFTTFGVN